MGKRGSPAALQLGGDAYHLTCHQSKGYAAYKIADAVTTREGWGLDSYCCYNVDPTIRQVPSKVVSYP